MEGTDENRMGRTGSLKGKIQPREEYSRDCGRWWREGCAGKRKSGERGGNEPKEINPWWVQSGKLLLSNAAGYRHNPENRRKEKKWGKLGGGEGGVGRKVVRM